MKVMHGRGRRDKGGGGGGLVNAAQEDEVGNGVKWKRPKTLQEK